MPLTFYGLGTALPPYPMPQDEAVRLALEVSAASDEQATLLKALYRRSGVKTRYTALPYQVGYEWFGLAGDSPLPASKVATLGPTTQDRMTFYRQLAPELITRAAGEALERAEILPREITHLVTVSCTGFSAPGIDIELIKRLGLPATTERVQVGFMGCHGAINGMRAARGLAAADSQARILLASVELCSLHCRFDGEPGKVVSSAIFADGAAALVGGATPLEGEWQLVDCGSCLIPDSTDAMSWDIGDNGFEMQLSSRVPDLIRTHLRDWMIAWLARNGLTLEQVETWAIHPGGPRVLTAVETSLGLPAEATSVSREVLSECGNMSSATVLFILDRLRRREAPRPCVALGFGPGLMAEAALFR